MTRPGRNPEAKGYDDSISSHEARAKLMRNFPEHEDLIQELTSDDQTYEAYEAIAMRYDTQYAVPGRTSGWRVVLDTISEVREERINTFLPSPSELQELIDDKIKQREDNNKAIYYTH